MDPGNFCDSALLYVLGVLTIQLLDGEKEIGRDCMRSFYGPFLKVGYVTYAQTPLVKTIAYPHIYAREGLWAEHSGRALA
jgi:hypothetical protein